MAPSPYTIYYDYMCDSQILIIGDDDDDLCYREAVGGLLFEVESKIVGVIARMLERGSTSMDDVMEVLGPDMKEGETWQDHEEHEILLTWQNSLKELPVTLTEHQLVTYLDRYTNYVIPMLDGHKAESVADNMGHLKDFLLGKLPHLKYYTENMPFHGPDHYGGTTSGLTYAEWVTEKMEGAIVFQDTSKQLPTFYYLAYGLDPAPGGERKTPHHTTDHKRKRN